MTWTPARLPAALRARGLRVVEMDDWLGYGYDTLAAPPGVMVHETVISYPCGDRTAEAMREGRSDLRGPLCNIHPGIDVNGRGVVYLVAGRRARHAGRGSSVVLSEVKRGVAPSAYAGARGLEDDTDGNRNFVGVEVQWHPRDGRWPVVLADTVAMTLAVVAIECEFAAEQIVAHGEWTRRKIDPSAYPIVDLRAQVADIMRGDDVDATTLKTAMRQVLNEATARGQSSWNSTVEGLWARTGEAMTAAKAAAAGVKTLSAEVAQVKADIAALREVVESRGTGDGAGLTASEIAIEVRAEIARNPLTTS